jgi:phosphate transport system protein
MTQEPERDVNSPAPAALSIDRRIAILRRRLVREASVAIAMLEAGIDALLRLDAEAARGVRRQDDRIDQEEVEIEQECYALITLHNPFARDFRTLAFILKVNGEVERVADHACSIAKVAIRMRELLGEGAPVPRWPTALVELSQRVPLMCHELMRIVLSEDVEAARGLVSSDRTIDTLDRQLFQEVVEWIEARSVGDATTPAGLLMYRSGRELERIGDHMAGIAEDIVYLATGSIIRHEKRRLRPRA